MHCGLAVESDRDGAPVRILPDRQHPVSQGFVCAKGIRFLEVANHPSRILRPMLRDASGFRAVSWETALRECGSRLRRILANHGPDAVALYLGTPAIHNALGAMAYFAFARAIGTRNLYSAGSQDNNSKIVAARLVHGNEWVQPVMDLERADFALLLGTNPLVSRGTYMQLPGGTTAFDRFVQRGGRVVFVDPRRSESAARWGGHLPIRPGTDAYLLLSLLHELRDLHTVRPNVEGMEGLLAIAARWPAQRAASLCGIDSERIRQLAGDLRSSQRATFFLSVGVSQSGFGTLCAVALQALALLTGNFDRDGGLLFQPWSGALASLLRFSRRPSRIGGHQPNAGGLPAGILADEILTPGEGRIRALIVFAGNPLTSAADEHRLRAAFRDLDLLISIDLFANDTSEHAHVVLPATTWLERFDVGAWNAPFVQAPFLDASGPVMRCNGDARPEWRIFAELSLAAGRPMFGPATRLLRRISWDRVLPGMVRASCWPFARYMRGGRGVPWRAPRGGSYLRRKRRVRFWCAELDAEPARLEADAAARATTASDPHTFVLIGRRRSLAQNSWLHGGTRGGSADAYASMCPGDMDALGLTSGDTVTLRSRTGTLRISVRADAGVMSGTVAVPHGLPGTNVNRLIPADSALIEPLSGMHRLSGNSVQVEVAR